jgi:hypothetical protein
VTRQGTEGFQNDRRRQCYTAAWCHHVLASSSSQNERLEQASGSFREQDEYFYPGVHGLQRAMLEAELDPCQGSSAMKLRQAAAYRFWHSSCGDSGYP